MALRIFRSNPSLGGFGGDGEQDPGDALAQIVKELTDNAVDACAAAPVSSTPKRVRVVIERYGDDNQHGEVLRVTVSDNGIGMKDIQACVDAFRTSKAANEGNADATTNTAGRYGVGLTLSLVHAQRLIAGSCSSIQSSTGEQSQWTKVMCVVDADHDSIRCVREERLPKAMAGESGTSVMVLVPGGESAERVWPRLAEYFARFQLTLGLTCSLEVLAPTLARVPLMVRPVDESKPSLSSSQSSNESGSANKKTAVELLQEAARRYLEQPVDLNNVSHAVVPIRMDGQATGHSSPRLEVGLIVLGPLDDEEDGSATGEEAAASDDEEVQPMDLQEAGKLVIVRIVNRVPLLDTAEAVACGVVQGLAANKRVWNSFGLDVALYPTIKDSMKLPTLLVHDSEQVAPFLRKTAHDAFEEDDTSSEDESSDDEKESDGETAAGKKRKRKAKRAGLLPAKIRLANVLLIVQIHANPATLPLPSLSKGRLPANSIAIDNALEQGVVACLQQLQKSNPSLLLTANELRLAERDARYVPAVSYAMATILANAKDPSPTTLNRIRGWRAPMVAANDSHAIDQWRELDNAPLTVEEMTELLEARLRSVLVQKPKKKTANDPEEAVQEEPGSQSSWHDPLDSSGDDTSVAPSTASPKHTNAAEMDDDDDWF